MPCRCLLFLKLENIVYVLCQPCEYQSKAEKQKSSKMFSHWSISLITSESREFVFPHYYLVEMSCVNQQEWVVMEEPDLFCKKARKDFPPNVLWIHNMQHNWVDFFLHEKINN